MSIRKRPRVRFAPSPTGKLHLGGARTAIYNWAFARANNGTFILRIEDTDPTRSTEENTQVILRAMRWLGLDWDEGPEVGGNYGPYFQTQRMDRYRKAAEKLVAEGKAYYCFCTAEKLEADRRAAAERKDPYQGYARTCRNIDPTEAQARVDAGEPYTIRIKVPLDRGDVVVHDLIHGDVVFNAKELDDFIIFRSDGTPTYNFAVVIDDADMEITHVIRGDDHLSNTPRQVIVYEALGIDVPVFAHLSMILGPDGKKLSKRHGATSVEEYRDLGYLPDVMVNQLALLGWSLDGETTIISRDTIASEFSLDHVSKNPSTFDPKKLQWMQSQYVQAMSDEEFSDEILIPELHSFELEPNGECSHEPEWYDLLSSILKPRVTLPSEIIEKVAFLYAGDELDYDEKSVEKHLAKDGARSVLDAAQDALSALAETSWHAHEIDTALEILPEKLDLGKGKVYQPIRVACCGSQVSPPLGESLELLGRELTLLRLERAKQLAL